MWDALWNEAEYDMQMIHCFGMALDGAVFFLSLYIWMAFAQSSTA